MTDQAQKQPIKIIECLLNAVIDTKQEQAQTIVDSVEQYNKFKVLAFSLIDHWVAKTDTYGKLPENLTKCTKC